MLKKLIVTAAVLAIVTAANATISADWGLDSTGVLPDAGDTYFAYRITVDVTDTPPDDPHGYTPGPDDWTAAGIELSLVGGTFLQVTGSGNPPDPFFFPFVPDMPFDSYYTGPGTYPTTDYADPNPVGIASSNDTATFLDTDWFDTVDTGNGDGLVIAQFTVIPDDPGTWNPDVGLDGLLQYAARNSGGTLFEMVIPEPGTLALLALGGLALIRRR